LGAETKTVEAEDKLPTRANILSAFKKIAALVREAGTGVVHVHFSGHAMKLATEYESLKKPGDIDEAILPYDARRIGEVIRDVELNILIWELSQLGARVSVVFDCCHAGSVNRGGDDESDSDDDYDTSRSADVASQPAENVGEATNRMPPAADGQEPPSLTLDNGELAKALMEAWAESKKHWMMLPINCDMFCSCYEDEKSYEMAVKDSDGNEVFHGVYTGMLLQALEELKEARRTATHALTSPQLPPIGPTLGHLHDRILAAFKREKREAQTPLFVGNRKRHWLRTTEGDDVRTLSVVGYRGGQLILSEGQIQGVTKGSRYIVVPWSQLGQVDSASSTGPFIEIVEVKTAQSYAEWWKEPPDDGFTQPFSFTTHQTRNPAI
jgi:hypothetical protein